jgi:hypothetical protein
MNLLLKCDSIQWAAERAADEVTALSSTYPPSHLPPRNDAECEAQEERDEREGEPGHSPESYLEFEILNPHSFRGRVNGVDPAFRVTYSLDFRRASVRREDGVGEFIFCDGDLEVAEALLGIRPRKGG